MTDFQSLAVLALQKASEAYLVALSSNTPICVPFTQNVSPSCPRISSCRLEGSKESAQKPSVSVLERFDCNGLVVVKPFAFFNLIVHQVGDT